MHTWTLAYQRVWKHQCTPDSDVMFILISTIRLNHNKMVQ